MRVHVYLNEFKIEVILYICQIQNKKIQSIEYVFEGK